MPPVMREGGRLLVVGGDAAGMSAASRARRLRPDVEIIVLERGRIVSYGACSLPYYVSGVVDKRDDLIAYEADFFRRERHIDVRLESNALVLDPRARTVTYDHPGGTETIKFDALVIGTGARAAIPPLSGMELRGVFTLRTIPDGDAIRQFIEDRNVRNASVLGGGYIGLEMAEALVERGIKVTILELLSSVLSNYDPDMSEIVSRELMDKGVIVRTETKVDGFEKGTGEAVGYVVAGGQRLPSEMVIVSAGVRPNTALAESGGLELGKSGAIRVDARQITSEPSILAAGDCSEAVHMVTGRPTWVPLGTTANRQGRIAGENAVGGSRRFAGVAGTNVTKIFGLEAAQTGLSTRAAEEAGLAVDSARIRSRSRSHAYPGGGPLTVKIVFEKETGRVLGAQIIGAEGAAKRIDTVATAIYGRMTVSDLAAIDMSYAPPFSPVWDPVLVAAGQAVKKLGN